VSCRGYSRSVSSTVSCVNARRLRNVVVTLSWLCSSRRRPSTDRTRSVPAAIAWQVHRVSYTRTHAGASSPVFLQVRENWKKSGNLSGQGKSGKIFFFGKVTENKKIGATRCLKCIKFDFRWGSALQTLVGSLQHSPDPHPQMHSILLHK